ncbi:MAG: SDR family oxidoreductase [Polyangiaceae bacterium]|nr:SDR family oxidoreductase [Polyangiaceae bacterium]
MDAGPSFAGKVVLVTGGTRGIGRAIALEFARRGAETVLTYRWGTADESELRAAFAALGAPEPMLVQADAAEEADTEALIRAIGGRHSGIDVFVSNVAGSVVVRDFDAMTERALAKSIHYSSWPTFAYLKRLRAAFGRYPRYVIAMSSSGPDAYSPGYEFVAASKAVLETLCRYATYRLRDEDVRINVVRAGAILTQSATEMFGSELFPFLDRLAPPDYQWLTMEEVANVAVALASGMLDSVRGQVITVDHGDGFSDKLMRLYAEREALGL